jgi:hypothetical protein
MLLSHKINKSQSLPNIKSDYNSQSNNTNINQVNNSNKKVDFSSQNNKMKYKQTITIMDTTNDKSMLPKYYINYLRNNSLIENKNKKLIKDFERIKIFKGKAIEILNRNEQNKRNKKNIKISNEYNKRHLYLFKSSFNYLCGMEKNEIFCMNMNKKPIENEKQKFINFVNNQINLENYEFKIPRMVNILNRNKLLKDKIFYQTLKYTSL